MIKEKSPNLGGLQPGKNPKAQPKPESPKPATIPAEIGKKAKAVVVAALLLCVFALNSFAAVGGMTISGASSAVWTNRLLTVLDGSGVTNRVWFTNSATPSFGDTNAIHIRTNSAAGRWEWRTNFASVVATNDSNRPTGTWHRAAVGAAIYGTTRYEPRSTGIISTTPSITPTTYNVTVDADGVVVAPTNFFDANSTNFPSGGVDAATVAAIMTTNNAGSATTATTASTVPRAGLTNADWDSLVSHSPYGTNSVGQPLNANFERLWRFRNTIEYTNRPIRIVLVSDELEFPGGLTFANSLYNMFGIGGGITVYGGTVGGISETASTSPPAFQGPGGQTLPTNEYQDTTRHWHLTNGAMLTINRQNGGSGTLVTDTNLFADTFRVAWKSDPRGGTFKIQTNQNGTTWGDHQTYSSFSASATNLTFTNVVVPQGLWSYRLVGLTGTNRICGNGMWNSQSNSVIIGSIAINAGPTLTDLANAEDRVKTNWWKYLDPDLIMILDSGILGDPTGNATRSAVAGLETMWSNNCPNADVIHFGWINYTVPADTTVANKALRESALKYGRAFFDSAYYINAADMVAMTNNGIMQVDGVHPVQGTGGAYLNGQLWPLVFPANTVNNPVYSNPKFQGAGAKFLRGYIPAIRGDPTTSGQIQIVPTNGLAFWFDTINGTISGIWGASISKGGANNWNFAADSSGSTYINSDSYVRIYDNGFGTPVFSKEPNGSLIFGDVFANQADVGVGNARFNGKVVVSDNLQSTNGILIKAVSITSGSGSPESVVTAPVGSIFLRTDGGSTTSIYVKTNGTGNTGWGGK